MKKKIFFFYLWMLLISTTTDTAGFTIHHGLTDESIKKIEGLVERLENALKEVQRSFDKTDNNVYTLLGHLGPEHLSRIVTQTGIALAAGSTTVLSSYLLYLILSNEIYKSYHKNEPMSHKIMSLVGLNVLFLISSITVLLYSGTIAQHYSQQIT